MSTYPLTLKTICNFIEKADKNLEEKLKSEGYIEPQKTVSDINDMNDNLTQIVEDERDFMLKDISDNTDIETILDEIFPILCISDCTDEVIAELFKSFLSEFTEKITNSYINDIDKDLAFNTFCDRTTDWINSWSEDLGKIMKLNSHEELQSILTSALEKGESIDKTVEKIMNTYAFSEARARRTAITEILTAHSYAKQEAIRQSPVVDRKEWQHSGSHKNKPRPHHQAMNGQIVGKNEKFIIKAPNGTYQCDFPLDTSLPASERVNCHCTHKAITRDDIFGLSVEERKELQRQAIENDNGEWEKELSAKNKAKAKINEDTINYDWIRAKTKEEQIKYFGGVKGKWALLESGVIKNDKDLEKMFKTVTLTKNGENITTKTFKTLQELRDDGIITVSHTAVKHSTTGEFSALGNPKLPPSNKNGGRPNGGGHSQSAINELTAKGFPYNIEKTFCNGVRIGNIPNHTDKMKRAGTIQSWFPQNWSDDDVLVAGTYVVNNPLITENLLSFDGKVIGHRMYQNYNGVITTVITDNNKKVGTIFPNNNQRKLGD